MLRTSTTVIDIHQKQAGNTSSDDNHSSLYWGKTRAEIITRYDVNCYKSSLDDIHIVISVLPPSSFHTKVGLQNILVSSPHLTSLPRKICSVTNKPRYLFGHSRCQEGKVEPVGTQCLPLYVTYASFHHNLLKKRTVWCWVVRRLYTMRFSSRVSSLCTCLMNSKGKEIYQPQTK